mmetsp:Transcript_20883/g.32206  ORF Transcript_20883/g.32206 Transcript_20883/m.32206 type:complete len:99 (+) Transcript_20883:664-960(+)
MSNCKGESVLFSCLQRQQPCRRVIRPRGLSQRGGGHLRYCQGERATSNKLQAQLDQNKIDDKSHVDKPSPLPTKNNWRDSDDKSHVDELFRFIPPKNY